MDKRFWVGFNLVKGIGAVCLQALQEYFGDLSVAWQAPLEALHTADLGPKLAERVLQIRAGPNLDMYMPQPHYFRTLNGHGGSRSWADQRSAHHGTICC